MLAPSAPEKADIWAIDTPLIDIISQVPDEIMTKITPNMGEHGELHDSDSQKALLDWASMPGVRYFPGGSGINIAKMANFGMNGNCKVWTCGRVADDRYGYTISRELETGGAGFDWNDETGMKCEFELGPKPGDEDYVGTGFVIVGVAGTNRSCMAAPREGANLLPWDDASPMAQALMKPETKVVILPGFFIHKFPDHARAIAQKCFKSDAAGNKTRCKVLMITLSTRKIAEDLAKDHFHHDAIVNQQSNAGGVQNGTQDAVDLYQEIWQACSVVCSAQKEYLSFGLGLTRNPRWMHENDWTELAKTKPEDWTRWLQKPDEMLRDERLMMLNALSIYSCANATIDDKDDVTRARGVFMTCHEKKMAYGAARLNDHDKGFRQAWPAKLLNVKDIIESGGDTVGCGDAFAGGVAASLAHQIANPFCGTGDASDPYFQPEMYQDFKVDDMCFNAKFALDWGAHHAAHVLTQRGCTFQGKSDFDVNQATNQVVNLYAFDRYKKARRDRMIERD